MLGGAGWSCDGKASVQNVPSLGLEGSSVICPVQPPASREETRQEIPIGSNSAGAADQAALPSGSGAALSTLSSIPRGHGGNPRKQRVVWETTAFMGSPVPSIQDSPSVGLKCSHPAPLPCGSPPGRSSDPEQGSQIPARERRGYTCPSSWGSPSVSDHWVPPPPLTQEKGLALHTRGQWQSQDLIHLLTPHVRWQEAVVSISHRPGHQMARQRTLSPARASSRVNPGLQQRLRPLTSVL